VSFLCTPRPPSRPARPRRLELSCGSGDETDSGSWTFLKKKQCEARVFPRVLMSEGREGRWGVKYLTDKGGAMALEMLYLRKPRDVLEEQVCVCAGGLMSLHVHICACM